MTSVFATPPSHFPQTHGFIFFPHLWLCVTYLIYVLRSVVCFVQIKPFTLDFIVFCSFCRTEFLLLLFSNNSPTWMAGHSWLTQPHNTSSVVEEIEAFLGQCTFSCFFLYLWPGSRVFISVWGRLYVFCGCVCFWSPRQFLKRDLVSPAGWQFRKLAGDVC